MTEGLRAGPARAAFHRWSLGAKLVCATTLFSVVAISVTFLMLSFLLKWHTKRLLAETLAQHQQTLSRLQQEELEELLRTSSLMTDSPTLRAAMETYVAEHSGRSSGARPDLLATIQTEADRAAARLGRDLLILTDATGQVLARSGAVARPEIGADLSVYPFVRRVLTGDGGGDRGASAVLVLGGGQVRVGCVPIVLRGYVIGTLTLGDRLDEKFAAGLARSLDCDVAIITPEGVVATTLERSPAPAALQSLLAQASTGDPEPRVVRLGRREYVAASEPLGRAVEGGPVELLLLTSLTAQLADSNRYLLLVVLFCGGWAIVLAGATAWWTSRTLLRPLEKFVGFMRAVATSGDHTRQFCLTSPSVEVETLNEAYEQLMASLLEHERRLLENARQELSRLERLKESEKLAALGRTLSGAAHEINNPLTGVLGHVEILLRDERLDPAKRRRLEDIQREGRRIASLVRNVLKIAHRETGEKRVVDVRDILGETVKVRQHDFHGEGMRVRLDLPEDPLYVQGNELELRQVFLNIVNNAYDAMRGSGPFAQMGIRAAAESERVILEFSNNGPAMEDPRRVFEHFYTTKPVGQGTGLGLGICHAIVQDHQGRMVAENLADGGVRFTIELPQARRPAPLRSAAPQAEPAAPAQGPLDASILVVDDEPTIVELQREILEQLGARVIGVTSGVEAIDQLRRGHFDLIVSDVKMPGRVSGHDLYRWVETHGQDPAPGFVFITGDTAGDGSREFVESVGASYVMKPFAIDDYVRMVREHCGGGRRES